MVPVIVRRVVVVRARRTSRYLLLFIPKFHMEATVISFGPRFPGPYSTLSYLSLHFLLFLFDSQCRPSQSPFSN